MAAPVRSIRLFPTRALGTATAAIWSTQHATRMTFAAARALTGDLLNSSSASEQIMATHARTFRFATRFLPDDYREQTINLYAFFRTLDDLVDESPEDEATRNQINQELDQWAHWFARGFAGAAPREQLGADLAQVRRQHSIQVSVFIDFLNGLRSDLSHETPEHREAVERYSYQVASTVGIAMAYVFQATGPQAIDAAIRLGIAMQLTNILRDVGGDAARGRVYLPADLLAGHELSPEDVVEIWRAGAGPNVRLRNVFITMIRWADEHYAAGIAGIRYLPPDVRMPILVAARLYQQVLRQLEQNDYDSLRMRVATTKWQKIREAYLCATRVE